MKSYDVSKHSERLQSAEWVNSHPTISNAYAVRAGFLKRVRVRPSMRVMMISHGKSLYRSVLAGARVLDWRNDKVLSAYNLHLGSISVLNKIVFNNLTHKDLHQLLPSNDPPKLKPEAQWLDPGYSQIVEQTNILRKSRTFL